MNRLFEYMLKVSVFCAVAHIFYWLLLSHLTNYKSNRFYLLFTSIAAFIIPLLRLDFFIAPQTINSSAFINHIPVFNAAKQYIPAANSVNFSSIIVGVFVIGITVCLTRFIVQLLSFKKITANAKLINSVFNIKLYHLNMDIMPFSFGNAVYVNQTK